MPVNGPRTGSDVARAFASLKIETGNSHYLPPRRGWCASCLYSDLAWLRTRHLAPSRVRDLVLPLTFDHVQSLGLGYCSITISSEAKTLIGC